MDWINDHFTDHFYATCFIGLMAGHAAWLCSKPKTPPKDVTTVAIIASTRNPLIVIAGLLGAILYTLQVPHL